MNRNSIVPCLGALGLAGSCAAQTCITDICFVDRAAAGQIVLGDFRGGLAVLDFDGDGWMDLVVAARVGAPTRLFRNAPDPLRPGLRTFVDATAGSGLDDADGTPRSRFGVVAGDYDNDGDPDVFMTGHDLLGGTHGLLYRNDGGGRFTNVSVGSGVRASGFTPESASWCDFDLDGDLDLLVCCIIPTARTFRLLVNGGDGAFAEAPGLLPPAPVFIRIYAHAWFDYDADGWSDCFVLNNLNPPILLKNVSDGAGGRRFVDGSGPAGYAFLGPAPMGIAPGDADGDGDLDVAVTDARDGTYYENLGDGTLRLRAPVDSIFGWGVTWIDADNDGDLDLYEAGSFGNPNADRLFRNDGAWAFADVSGALNTAPWASQFAVRIDFNNDGRPDLVTVNPGSPGRFVSVYENISPSPHHWLTVRLRGDGGRVNRDAVGAVVRVTAGGRTQVREVVNGSSTTSTEDPRAHFGLGSAGVVDRVEVLWPRRGSAASRTRIRQGPLAADRELELGPGCSADCDSSTGEGVLDVLDFLCFQNLFAAEDEHACSCDTGTGAAVCDVFDFLCFQNAFAAGCP